MAEPIQYDFEFVVRAKSSWLAPFAKVMAAVFYCIAIFGALSWHVVAAACFLVPDWKEGRDLLAGYQPGMITITHFAVMAIASSLVSALFRNKHSLRVRAQRSTAEPDGTIAPAKRGAPRTRADRERSDR